jgi:GH15 family glucan-1,4-alpha-glucosidase
MCSTWDRVQERLGRGPLIRRYEQEADLLPGREAAFVACAFWAVEYLARAGRLIEANERFEALLGYANDLGLYSEEVSPGNGELLGNFPQAFSHSGLVNAALAIAECERLQPK